MSANIGPPISTRVSPSFINVVMSYATPKNVPSKTETVGGRPAPYNIFS